MAYTYSGADLLLAGVLGVAISVVACAGIADKVKEDATKRVEAAIEECEAELPRTHKCVPIITAKPAVPPINLYIQPQSAPRTSSKQEKGNVWF